MGVGDADAGAGAGADAADVAAVDSVVVIVGEADPAGVDLGGRVEGDGEGR